MRTTDSVRMALTRAVADLAAMDAAWECGDRAGYDKARAGALVEIGYAEGDLLCRFQVPALGVTLTILPAAPVTGGVA